MSDKQRNVRKSETSENTVKKKMPKKQVAGVIIFLSCLFVLLLITFSLNWIAANFGYVGFDEIIFHINMPLKGTGDNYIGSYIHKALLPAAGIVVEVVAGCVIAKLLLDSFPKTKKALIEKTEGIIRHLRILAVLFLAVWLCASLVRAQRRFGLFDYMKNQIQQSSFIENEYVDAGSVNISFPEKKRNLIYILMESAETSTMDKKNGGLMDINYIPEMTELAKEGVSFSHSDLLEGAAVAPNCGWTIAGMLAESAGLPLKMYGNHRTDKIDNSMDDYDSFMPGITTLGDILEEEGYRNVFMAGSEFEFGGRLNYTTSHGHYEVLDYNEAISRGVIPSDYNVWWGFEDEVLYRWAKEELTELAKSDQPFNFQLLTVDTHAQDGYVCNLCENEYSDQYANVWRCASKQVYGFVRWCQEQPFYENTTIVIAGDHCSMDKDFYGNYTYETYNGEATRKVYEVFLNATVEPLKENNRKFSTLDIYPTILASMGCTIDGERLGLGVNLFSDEQTIAEKYGYEYMFTEMSKQSRFYNRELMYPKDN